MSAPNVEPLKKWLADRGVSYHHFALSNGMDPSGLAKLLNGKRKRLSADFAMKIEQGTAGEVKAEDLLGGVVVAVDHEEDEVTALDKLCTAVGAAVEAATDVGEVIVVPRRAWRELEEAWAPIKDKI